MQVVFTKKFVASHCANIAHLRVKVTHVICEGATIPSVLGTLQIRWKANHWKLLAHFLNVLGWKLLEHIKSIYGYLGNKKTFFFLISVISVEPIHSYTISRNNDFWAAFNNRKQIDTICLDLSKDFDQAAHTKLINRLMEMNINFEVVGICSYLTGLTHYVKTIANLIC